MFGHSSNDAEKARQSGAFKRAREAAESYAQNNQALRKLSEQATRKAAKLKDGPLREVWDYLQAYMRLLKAYANGEYRTIPWQSLLLIIATVLYFLAPLDAVPDFLLGFGYVDDIGLIAWSLKSLKHDVDAFLDWERGRINEAGHIIQARQGGDTTITTKREGSGEL